MTISIEPIKTEDFNMVYPLLVSSFSGSNAHSRTKWKQLFSNLWGDTSNHCGYMMINDNQVIGYLGGLFSKQNIRGIPHTFCNLTTWIVDHEHRQGSIYLLLPFLKYSNTTLTCMSASKPVAKILLKMGFQEISGDFKIILPLPLSRGDLFDNHDDIQSIISGPEEKIYYDHRSTPCHSMVFKSSSGTFYILVGRVIRHGVPFIRLYYTSDPSQFAANAGRVSMALCQKLGGVALLAWTNDFQDMKIPMSVRISQPSIYFKSDYATASDINLLYSELPLLNI
ncbi:MAG: hypothetical protein HQL71_13520 [Magnetococcales bacterium]|nr:hypothetical protein [Magnetococcales bacterium]